MQGEAPEGEGLWMPQHHRREHTELLCPLPTAPCSTAHGLSILQGHGRHRSGCTSPGLALPWCCARGTELTPAAKPPVPAPALQTPANIPPARSDTATATSRPQPRPRRARGSHRPPDSLGELGREPSWPLDHQPLPLAQETPAGPSLRPHACGHAPGTGREIKIPSAKVVPVLSALIFSSKDTKEFKHRA